MIAAGFPEVALLVLEQNGQVVAVVRAGVQTWLQVKFCIVRATLHNHINGRQTPNLLAEVLHCRRYKVLKLQLGSRAAWPFR